jgi:superfamily II DNA or RNA helicase
MKINYSKMELDYEHVHIYPYDNVNVIVSSLNPEFMLQIKSHFTMKKHNYQFTPAYKNGNWDGNIRFIWKNGLMPRGLLKDCVLALKQMNIPVKVDKSLIPKKTNIDDLQEISNEMFDKQEVRMEPYPYQWNVIKKIVKNERGIARAATSAGKTYITAVALNYLFEKKEVEKVLVIVPSIMLVVQMKENFVEEYGISKHMVGMFMGSVKELGREITIATWQSLSNIEDSSIFKMFDMVVVDECHKLTKGNGSSKKERSLSGGSQIKKILDKCKNAKRRIGVTGTMPTDEVDKTTLIGCLGPVMIEVTAKELMDKGHVTQLQIVCPIIQYDKEMIKGQMDYIKREISEEWQNRKGEFTESDWKLIR